MRPRLLSLFLLALPAAIAARPGSSIPTPPPGRAYLFTLDLQGTPLDEFPSGVKALNGVMTVVDKDGQHMLLASSPSELLITLPQILPTVFTVEVDLIPKRCCNPDDIMLEGTPTRNRGVASAELTWHPERISAVGGGGEMYQSNIPDDLAAAAPGNLTHLVFEFNGPTIKLWTNGRRLYTLEKQFVRGRVLRVWLGGESATNPMYLAGLRVGAGPAAPEVIAASSGVPGGDRAQPQTETNVQSMTGSPVPTFVANVTVTQGSAGPVVSWLAVAAPATYSVKRWKSDDQTCCNNNSANLTGPPWQDVQPPLAGTYLYQVTVTTNGGTASGQAQFVIFKQGGQIASSAPSPPPAPVTAVLATQTGTITPMPASPPPPPTLPPERMATRDPSVVVLDDGLAPTGLTASGTPGTASISWQPVAGATGYQVDRTPLGSPNWATLTASRISEAKLSDFVPDPLATYTYRVTAYQANGHYGFASVDFKPPAPTDPTELVATLVPPAGVRLTWKAVNGAKEYVISGPGFASDARASTTSASLTKAPPGLDAYRVASVFPPGQVLTAVSAWPSAVVKVPPVPSLTFLTLPNGLGSLAEYNRHACDTGKWLAAELVWPNDWCSVPGPNSVAKVELKPLLDLFGIKLWAEWEGPLDPTNWSTYSERPWAMLEQRATGLAAFESIWWEPKFIDEVDLARERRVGCTTRGTVPNTSMLCWAVSKKPGEFPPGGGPQERRGTVTILLQEPNGTHFLSFKEVEDAASPTGWKMVGSPTAELDSQGERFLPHVCLPCHGGRINSETGKVTGASALALDPAGFSGLPGELVNGGQNSAAMYRVHQAMLKAPLAPGVQEYINHMYVSNPNSTPYISLSVIPPGWSEQPEIYAKIIRPYCARCHSVQPLTLGFRSWADVVLEKVRIRQSVCTGRMPHSETAFRKFWSDGGSVSLPGWLLGALGYAGCP